MYVCFGVYDCFMPGYTIPPNSRIVSRLYRKRTMEKLRTNEEARSNELKQVSLRKPDQTCFEQDKHFNWSCSHGKLDKPVNPVFSRPNDKRKHVAIFSY